MWESDCHLIYLKGWFIKSLLVKKIESHDFLSNFSICRFFHGFCNFYIMWHFICLWMGVGLWFHLEICNQRHLRYVHHPYPYRYQYFCQPPVSRHLSYADTGCPLRFECLNATKSTAVATLTPDYTKEELTHHSQLYNFLTQFILFPLWLFSGFNTFRQLMLKNCMFLKNLVIVLRE